MVLRLISYVVLIVGLGISGCAMPTASLRDATDAGDETSSIASQLPGPTKSPTSDDWTFFLPVIARDFREATATVTPSPMASCTPTPTQTSSPTIVPLPTPTVTPTVTGTPTIGRSLFGVQMVGEEWDNRYLDLATAAGVKWVRTWHYVRWADVEPVDTDPADFNWGSVDGAIKQMVARGLIPIVNVEGNPCWASTNGCLDRGHRDWGNGPIDKPGGLAAFHEFVRALAERYDGDGVDDAPGSPVVNYFEFYNEQDSQGRWYGQGAAYAAMLKEAWPAVHEANPAGKVVFGGLAYEPKATWCGGPCFDRNFLSTVIANATGPDAPYFDVINYHYYPRLAPLWPSYWPAEKNVVTKGLGLLNDQVPANLRSMPIMCTEFSEAFAGPPADPPYNQRGSNRYIVKGFTQLMASPGFSYNGLTIPRFESGIWFTFRLITDESFYNGLVDTNATPYDGYYTYQTVARELAGASFNRRLGVAGVEGYVFNVPGGGEKLVAWTTGGTVSVSLEGTQHRLLRLTCTTDNGPCSWQETVVDDGGTGDGDGNINGQIEIQVGEEPTVVQRIR